MMSMALFFYKEKTVPINFIQPNSTKSQVWDAQAKTTIMNYVHRSMTITYRA